MGREKQKERKRETNSLQVKRDGKRQSQREKYIEMNGVCKGHTGREGERREQFATKTLFGIAAHPGSQNCPLFLPQTGSSGAETVLTSVDDFARGSGEPGGHACALKPVTGSGTRTAILARVKCARICGREENKMASCVVHMRNSFLGFTLICQASLTKIPRRRVTLKNQWNMKMLFSILPLQWWTAPGFWWGIQ